MLLFAVWGFFSAYYNVGTLGLCRIDNLSDFLEFMVFINIQINILLICVIFRANL